VTIENHLVVREDLPRDIDILLRGIGDLLTDIEDLIGIDDLVTDMKDHQTETEDRLVDLQTGFVDHLFQTSTNLLIINLIIVAV